MARLLSTLVILVLAMRGLAADQSLPSRSAANASTDQDPSGIAITRTPNGDYEIKYSVGTEQKTAVYVPATKIVPLIVSTIRAQQDGKAQKFVYSYRFRNGRDALQEMAAVEMHVLGLKSAVVDAPIAWRYIATQTTERIVWMRSFDPDRIQGLPAGDEASGFTITTGTSYLPGPESVSCRGNVLTVMPDIPPAVFEKLRQAQSYMNFVSTSALLPSIRFGNDEPDLTPAAAVTRVLSSYFVALQRSQHASREKVIANLRDAIRTLPTDKEAGARALADTRNAALNAGQDEWAKSLGQGLALCIDFIRARFGL